MKIPLGEKDHGEYYTNMEYILTSGRQGNCLSLQNAEHISRGLIIDEPRKQRRALKAWIVFDSLGRAGVGWQ
jgi:hypothetical protein